MAIAASPTGPPALVPGIGSGPIIPAVLIPRPLLLLPLLLLLGNTFGIELVMLPALERDP
jgi:hypothetical protein